MIELGMLSVAISAVIVMVAVGWILDQVQISEGLSDDWQR